MRIPERRSLGVALSLGLVCVPIGKLNAQDVACPPQLHRQPMKDVRVGANGGWVITEYAMVYFPDQVIESPVNVSIIPDPAIHAFTLTASGDLNDIGVGVTVYFNPWVCRPTGPTFSIRVGTNGAKQSTHAETVNGTEWVKTEIKAKDLDIRRLRSGFIILSN